MVAVSIALKTLFVAIIAVLATGVWGVVAVDGTSAPVVVQTAETVADLGFVTIF